MIYQIILILIIFFNGSTPQQFNLITSQTLDKRSFATLLLNNQFIYLTDSANHQYVYQYDLTTNQMVQNRSQFQSIVYMNTLFIVKQSILIGNSNSPNNIIELSLLNLQITNYQSNNALYSIYSFEYDSATDFLLVGTFSGLEKWQHQTMIRLESIQIGQVNSLLLNPTRNSFYLGGVLFKVYYDIQERSLFNLSTILNSLHGHNNDILEMTSGNGFLYSCSSDFSVRQWNISSSQFNQKYMNHTSYVYTIAYQEPFLFSGGNDQFWIQWVADTGLVYRKIDTGGIVYNLLVVPPFLLVASATGLLKYAIPEIFVISKNNSLIVSSTATVDIPSTTVHLIESSTLIQIQIAIESTIVQSTLESIQPATTDNFLPTATFSIKQSPTTSAILAHFNNQITTFPIYYLIGLLGGGVLVLFCFALFLYCLVRRKKKQLAKTTTTTTTTSSTGTNVTSNGETSRNHTSSSSSTATSSTLKSIPYTDTANTLVGTQNVYSIPGYLELKKEEIRLIKQIAKGGQGTVSIAEVINEEFQRKFQTTQVIIKSTGKKYEELTERHQNVFNQELAIIQYFKDKPGFVRVFGYISDPAALILKFYFLGSMENLMLRKGQFRDLVTTKKFHTGFLLKISNAISLLHGAGFVHSDIKPQNILIDVDQQKRLNPILTDFGITQVVSDKVLQVKAMTVENIRGCSIYYASPEQIQQLLEKKQKPMGAETIKKRDVYAIGGLIYGLIMKKEPWQ